MTKTIGLPDSMPEFREKTLIACLGHDSAVFYTGEGNTLTGPESFAPESVQYEYTDKEGFDFSRKGTRGTTPGTEVHNKEHYLRVFLNELQSKLQEFSQNGTKKLILFVPDDIKNMVPEKIPADLRTTAEFHSGNLAKEQPLKLLERIHA